MKNLLLGLHSDGELRLGMACPFIEPELAWRQPGAHVRNVSDMTVLRWSKSVSVPLDVASSGHEAMHCVALNLKCTTVDFDCSSKPLVRGRLAAGIAHVSSPCSSARARFSESCDVLHLYIPQGVLLECYEDLFGRPHGGEIVIESDQLLRDPTIDQLGRAMSVSQTSDLTLGRVFTDSVSLAIASLLVSQRYAPPRRRPRKAGQLPKWRMTRVMEYVDAHIGEPIGLADMAESAGLTRMHFAALFREASGLRPHEYLLRRRIERAQSLLIGSQFNLLDVAISCGFSSQAHFTTVFKRYVGETPHAWRMSRFEAGLQSRIGS
ncbi:AraC family transcriptional regulator [Paraburkholderia sp. 22B1P]|uniref:helix-turn-helix transcriptional regulator n=1 Tax=Paraburkholderia sp. 22B1P TaxID=3080498 RepID=UPI00308A51B9|nr:AraC family transcriptional regulator [Paraburkholderia sp. 22B1P]